MRPRAGADQHQTRPTHTHATDGVADFGAQDGHPNTRCVGLARGPLPGSGDDGRRAGPPPGANMLRRRERVRHPTAQVVRRQHRHARGIRRTRTLSRRPGMDACRRGCGRAAGRLGSGGDRRTRPQSGQSPPRTRRAQSPRGRARIPRPGSDRQHPRLDALPRHGGHVRRRHAPKGDIGVHPEAQADTLGPIMCSRRPAHRPTHLQYLSQGLQAVVLALLAKPGRHILSLLGPSADAGKDPAAEDNARTNART